MKQNYECMPKALTGESGITVSSDTVYSFPTHTHVYYELTCYDAFDGAITVNDHSISMDQAAAVLVTPVDFHRIHVSNPQAARFIKIAFDEELLSAAVRSRLTGPYVLQPLHKESLPFLLFQEIYSQRNHAEDALSLIQSLCFYISRYGQAMGSDPGKNHHNRMIEAVRFINANYCSDISLTSLAHALSISPQYLSSLFSKSMGISFSEYVQSLRLRRAAEMLLDADWQITELCFQCGFRNFSHFIRSFKKRYGVSPGVYRAQHKK